MVSSKPTNGRDELIARGRAAFREGHSKPINDGTAASSWLIAGWEAAAGHTGRSPDPFGCDCVSFWCPYHGNDGSDW